MGSKEIKQHEISIEDEKRGQSNKTSNDQANSAATSGHSSTNWKTVLLSFFVGHSSIERKVILLLAVVAVFLDPLFFYVPVVKNGIEIDSNLRIIVVVFRSFVDVLQTIMWWRHSLPSDNRYRPTLPRTLAILAILPLPQVIIALAWNLLTVRLLKFIVAIQFVLRLCRIIPAYKDATRSSDMLFIYAWFAAAFNLIMYTLASNVVGAFWYMLAIEQYMEEQTRDIRCEDSSTHNVDKATRATPFNSTIYDEAFDTCIISSHTHFLDKFFQGFWWGLRHLSSLGENLKTGTYIWDNFFAICITISGLVLFAFFIGNMQTYLQSKTPAKLERIKWRKNYLEGWHPFHLLPKDLREEVTWCEDPKWQEIIEVNLESLLNNIPTVLRKKLKPHLCKEMFSKIPEFENLRVLPRKKLCALAKPLVFPERSYIFKEGDPIYYDVVFVVDGNILSYDKQSKDTGVLAKRQSAGCFFGEELLQQLKPIAQQQQQQALNVSSLDVPFASKTIQAATKVEAFAFSAKDLNKVFATYHGRLYQSDNVDNWAASTIQEAWRKHAKENRSKASKNNCFYTTFKM